MRLLIWKIKHLASRLYLCKFPPPEEEADDASSIERKNQEMMQKTREIIREGYFREEDYIVFSFTDDGEIHLVEDTNSDTSINTITRINTNLWPLTAQGDDERWMNGKAQSDESSDSNQSQASTGSFAFPVLRWDWVGSPVKMPNPDGYRRHKFRARILRLQCCTFRKLLTNFKKENSE